MHVLHVLNGQEVEPGIARCLMDEGFVAEDRTPKPRARYLMLTDAEL